jgi:hypothetical protein
MPETSVNKDCDSMLRQDQIWPSWKILFVQPETKSLPMKKSSQGKLGRRVLAAYGGHDPRTSQFVDDIRHLLGLFDGAASCRLT